MLFTPALSMSYSIKRGGVGQVKFLEPSSLISAPQSPTSFSYSLTLLNADVGRHGQTPGMAYQLTDISALFEIQYWL